MLTSRCSLQILQSQMAWGRLLVVSTPHLVQTFCRESKAPGGSGDAAATQRSHRTSTTPRKREVYERWLNESSPSPNTSDCRNPWGCPLVP